MSNKVLIIFLGIFLFFANILFGFFAIPFITWVFDPEEFVLVVIPGCLVLSATCSILLFFVAASDKGQQKKKKLKWIFSIIYFLFSSGAGIGLQAARFSGFDVRESGGYIVSDENGKLYSKFGLCLISDENDFYCMTAITAIGEPVIIGINRIDVSDDLYTYKLSIYDTSGNLQDLQEIRVYSSSLDDAREVAKKRLYELDGISM